MAFGVGNMSDRLRITEEVVKCASSPHKTLFLRDDRQIGFAVRVTPKGAKSFIAEGRVNGRMRRFTIGSAGRFTVNEARGRAKALLAGMHDGIDQQFKKRAARERSDTLRAMLEAYLAAKGVKEATASKYRAQMQRNLTDWLDKQIAEISPQMVLLRYETISKRSVAEANGVMRALRAVCRRAMKVLPERSDGSPMMKRIPTESLTGGWKSLPRKTTLLQPDELPAWWSAVGKLKSEPSHRALLSLLVTGLRVSELLSLRWCDVDETKCRLTIGDSKTGAFEKIIGPELADWLSQWRGHGPDARVFAVDDLRAALEQVERHGGKRITPHDLRRTFLTFGERIGAPIVVLKRLANHSTKGDVTLGYVLPSEADLRNWAKLIEAAILSAARCRESVVEWPGRRLKG
jgi:integrase